MNDILYDLCKLNNIYFLSNDNISRSFICDDGIHLNQKGTHILASNFVTFINNIFNVNWLYRESCLTENCNSKCLSGNNINRNIKLSNNSDSVLSPLTNINEETDEDALGILNKRRRDNCDRLIFGNLNINSINSKFDQMKFLLQGKVDILVLSETKLDNSFPTNQFLIEGYSKPIRLDRNRNEGGLLVYIREDVPCKKLKSHSFAEDTEGTFIEINLRKCKWLLFAMYHPPSQCDKYFFHYLRRSLDIYSASYDKFVLIGDFNSEESEDTLAHFLNYHNASNLVRDKICFKSLSNPICIDLIITNKPGCFQNTIAASIGLSGCHKFVTTILKSIF